MPKDPLHDFVASANSEFGDNTAIILSDSVTIKCDVIPTGIGAVDKALGVGGIPRGRITEIYGDTGTGKTSLCLHTMVSAQKLGLGVLFIDAEHALSTERMTAIGVDGGKMVFSQPNSGEDALNLAEMAIRSGKFALVVIDSVAALTPLVEIEKDMGDSVMGVHAKLMSQSMRKLSSPVSKFNVAMMFINQTRANISGYGNPEVTTGGNALKFYSSLRLQMKFVGKISNTQGERISGKYKMTVVKNKVAVPFKVAEFEINEYGIDDTTNLIDNLERAGIFTKSGSWYKHEEKNLANGKPTMVQLLHKDPGLREKLVQALDKATAK